MQVTRQCVSRLDASAFKRQDETGFLDVRVFPTRAGVFPYLDKATGKTIRELRPREEVFKPESLKTLVNKPHTDNHPPVMVNSRNVKQYATGKVYGDHKKADDGIHTESRLQVEDETAIRAIEAGKHEVSCGYHCDIEETSGVHPEWGPYDRIQRNIVYNHLASVHRGRAGSGARVTADQSDERFERFDACEIEEVQNTKENKPLMNLKKMRVDGREVEVAEAAEFVIDTKLRADEAEIKSLNQKIADLNTQISKDKAKLDEAQEKLTKQQAKIDEWEEKQRKDSLEKVCATARKFLPKDFKFDGLSELDVKKAVVKAKRPEAKLDDEVYVSARFDTIVEDEEKSPHTDGGRDVLDHLDNIPPANFGNKDKVTKARMDMLEYQANAWKLKSQQKAEAK